MTNQTNYLMETYKRLPVSFEKGEGVWLFDKNGNKLQARYYWNYVLNLEKTEEDLKKKIDKKLIKGL